jgi:hypothetical protein
MTRPDTPISELTVDPVLSPAEERARLDIQLAQLDRLSEAGLDMARALADQASGTGPEVFKGDMALAYSRISRAVRMAILIQSRLMNDIQGRRKLVLEAEVERDNTRFNREQRRKGAVEDIVARICRADPDGYDEDEIDDCVREAGEHLDDDELYGDVLTRPSATSSPRSARTSASPSTGPPRPSSTGPSAN